MMSGNCQVVASFLALLVCGCAGRTLLAEPRWEPGGIGAAQGDGGTCWGRGNVLEAQEDLSLPRCQLT